jgi:hypothetical protein
VREYKECICLAEWPPSRTSPAFAITHTANGLIECTVFYRNRPCSSSLRARRNQHLAIMRNLHRLTSSVRAAPTSDERNTYLFLHRLLDFDGSDNWRLLSLIFLFYVMNFQSSFLCVIVQSPSCVQGKSVTYLQRRRE